MTPTSELVERARTALFRLRDSQTVILDPSRVEVGLDDLSDVLVLGHDLLALIETLQQRVERKDAALVALADGVEKCGQPFRAIYRKHGATIEEARADLQEGTAK